MVEYECIEYVSCFRRDWCCVNDGVKQGCVLPPLLFINDLAVVLKRIGSGVHIYNDVICVLM